MDPTKITDQSLIDLYRAYPERHPDRGVLVIEMKKRGILGEDAQIESFHKAAAKGNVSALRSFYNSGASGKIDWGKGGAFESCVAIASKHMTAEQANGFCAERHNDAVGKYPSQKAPVAKEDPYHVESGPTGGQFDSGGGGASSSTALPSNSPPPTSAPTVNYSSQGKKSGGGSGTVKGGGKNSGKKQSTAPHSQIPPTPKAKGQVPVRGLKKPTVHLPKPKTVAPIHAKKGSTHVGTHIAGKGPKISGHNPKIKLK